MDYAWFLCDRQISFLATIVLDRVPPTHHVAPRTHSFSDASAFIVCSSQSTTSLSACEVVLGSVHTSNNVEATFDFVVTNGNNVERFCCKISSFRQSRNKLNMFDLFPHCRKDEISFDIVAETGKIVAENGNNVEATFDFVERIIQLVAFDNVASTLLLVCVDWALDHHLEA